MKRVARNVVRIEFDPGDEQGTAMFILDLAREIGGTVDGVDRSKVLVKARALANDFVDYADREIHANAHRT